MSRFYNMQIQISKFNKNRIKQITEACADEWSFDELDIYKAKTNSILSGEAEGYLGGGETEEEFTDRISEAIWKANKGYCPVSVTATYLEDMPYEIHERLYDDYRKWKKKAA